MHIYLLDAGFVMYMDGEKNTLFSGAIIMEYSLIQTAALGCQIRYLLCYMFIEWICPWLYCSPR